MPITANCPNCGHTVKAPDNAAGKKGKCPRCGGIVLVPDMPEILDDDDDDEFLPPPSGFTPSAVALYPSPPAFPSVSDTSPKAIAAVPQNVIGMVVGKPAKVWGYRSSFGRTTLAFTADRLIETTRRPIEERDCEIPLGHIDSVEMTAKGNPFFIALAVMTVSLFTISYYLLVVPFISVVLFFILKHRFLIVCSNANLMVVGVKGGAQPYRDFMKNLLSEVEHFKASR